VTGPDIQGSVSALLNEIAAQAEQLTDQERDHRRAIDSLLRHVLEIADGIERMQVAQPAAAAGLQALGAQVQELLADQGLAAFRPAVGSEADGRTCEVLATVATPGLRPGTVTSVIRTGYRGGDRIVRRAGVEIVREH
jgi:molecular chaperone GrpE (heat shock protein)